MDLRKIKTLIDLVQQSGIAELEITEPEGNVRIVKDFLPLPSQLVLRDDNVKVTLSLSRRSINFFKREAKKQHVPYQKMIRALVDGYAERLEK